MAKYENWQPEDGDVERLVQRMKTDEAYLRRSVQDAVEIINKNDELQAENARLREVLVLARTTIVDYAQGSLFDGKWYANTPDVQAEVKACLDAVDAALNRKMGE